MNNILFVFLGIFIPFVGTCMGALSALVVKKTNKTVESLLYGFSAGVMISASIFSLIIPSIETNTLKPNWLIPTLGLISGGIFMLVVDWVSEISEGGFSRSKKIVLAITCHNIPEGMAVGITLSGVLLGEIEMLPALLLAIGISVQNIPEGAIISLPLVGAGESRLKSVALSVFSATVEMFGAILALFLTSFISKLLPLFLAFSAGAMIWVSVKELIPETKGKVSALLVMIGFALMMILDLL